MLYPCVVSLSQCAFVHACDCAECAECFAATQIKCCAALIICGQRFQVAERDSEPQSVMTDAMVCVLCKV